MVRNWMESNEKTDSDPHARRSVGPAGSNIYIRHDYA
jgi:hypothetical protein